MKLKDSDAMDIKDPKMFLDKKNLEHFYRLCFFCRNLRSQLIIEALSSLFFCRKFIDGFRYMQRINTLFNVIQYTSGLICVFFGCFYFLIISCFPIVQAIYGTYLFSFKYYEHIFTRLLLLNFGKADFL